ncbi:MAG: hypothetical protein CMH95_00940 [Oceanospirillaceae bacterium]|uniref:SPOR domain-containing protein n=1 Tax=Thalassolituus sp. TaxID=2030822 RepID=UPI000C68C7C5|nr:AAA family ATPase [Thalassolituus sp.]MAG42861.1 hypothetical protein [Oceanospirillaceae bacterium]MEE3160161.1 AAA family ATPase [Pseudomonadota bacterium]|tara:strand:+ start:6451 stop:7947 length:1497 start_codon:yes stop_codon:yes gene_type:complete
METDFDLDLSGVNVAPSSAGNEAFSMHSLLDSQKRHVELLSHLASYSELLVAVTGFEGAGKSFIANNLAAQREAPDETLLLTASVMLGMPGILSSIAAHWDMPAIHEDGAQAREAIRNEAIDRSQAGGNLLLIIDQADQLDAETLNDIAHFALLAPQAISVILFGAPGYETHFRNSPAQAPVHVLAVEPLTDSEIAALMASVFGDGEVCPFGDKELADIMMDSGCLPGPALRQGERILSSSTRPAATASAAGFPLRNILAIAGVVTAIAMVFIYQWGASSQDDELSPEIQTQLDSVKDFNYPGSDVGHQAEAGNSEGVTLADRVVVEATDGEEAGAVNEEAPSADSGSGIVKANTESSSEIDAVSMTEGAGSGTPAVKAEAAKPQAAQVEAATAQPKTPSYTPDEQALLAPESGYIVQLLGSHSSTGAETFRDQWQSQVTGTLYRYQTTYKGKDWFVVVSGVYSSRAEARAAVNAMPSSLRKQSPWVRPVGDVQKVIR